jgi:hypothetical protein
LPQIEPVASARNVNDAPMGAQAAAAACASLMRQIMPMPAATAMTTYTNMDIQALGAWTYRMRKASPCW